MTESAGPLSLISAKARRAKRALHGGSRAEGRHFEFLSIWSHHRGKWRCSIVVDIGSTEFLAFVKSGACGCPKRVS